ncbi:NnrU family protein [Piscinibacter sp. XHJ-5]|uniref:NnrU family protein n=1 Tax=Piscinibacter sp. XHJ-5 TaxID=3037797 RepID=UPI00245325C2|nr:NnrU family protein [Piscinibacter sp. XHJ-5]
MTLLVLGLVLFLGVHSVSIAAPAWRDAQVALRGEKAWKGLYSLVSIAGFVLLVIGYGAARQSPIVLYTPPTWTRHLALLLMLPVFPLLIAAYMPGRIKAAVKHPFLVAVKLWATAHLLANGTLADVLLFGGFLAWAVADRISMKRRAQRPLPGAPERPMNDLIAVVVGLVIYGVFVTWLHRWLIGVQPLP